jgi:hypothetical protein
MVFLAPLALGAFALITLPVLIHLLVRRRAPRIEFPTLRFLREAQSFRLHPRNIQQPLLLALRLLALILLIIGFARPLIRLNTQEKRTHIILLDASLSMQARGRTEAAQKVAGTIINELNVNERAAILSFAANATTLVAPTNDQQKLLDAIMRYQPTAAAADYRAGFAAIRDLAARERLNNIADVALISDCQRSNLNQIGSDSLDIIAPLKIYAIGARVNRNAFMLNPEIIKGARGIILSATEFILAEKGQSSTRHTLVLDAEEGARDGIWWKTEPNGEISGEIDALTPDDFDADDKKFFAFNQPREQRTLLIDSNAEATTYLRAALGAAIAYEKAEHILEAPLDERKILPATIADLNSYSMVVAALDIPPNDRQLQALIEFVRRGGTVWLCLGQSADTVMWNKLADSAQGVELPFVKLERKKNDWLTLATADHNAPILRSFDESAFALLQTVRVRCGFSIEPREQSATLMRWSDDNAPAFVSRKIGEGNILLLATSPQYAASDLGGSAAFPALVAAITRASNAPRETLSYEIGEPINLRLAPQTLVKITDTAGRLTETRADRLVRQPFDLLPQPGIYKIEWPQHERFIALNVPAIESATALASPEEVKEQLSYKENVNTIKDKNLDNSAERSQSVWRYFLAAAFLLLVAELLLMTRSFKREQ